MLSENFRFTSVSGSIDPLGPLALLPGVWRGAGVNQIWRPFNQPGQDRFLELNETEEILAFEVIHGDIPNRGLLQPDINLRAVAYHQEIQDAHTSGARGIHDERGYWLSVPATVNPVNPATVARLAAIPHGAVPLMQGVGFTFHGGPTIQAMDIDPFPAGQPNNHKPFPEQDLATETNFRTPANDIPNVTQAIVDGPNSVLTAARSWQSIGLTTVLKVSNVPANPPATGGGVENIAFLTGAAGGPNAQAVQVDATFWIEQVITPGSTLPIQLQLQYSQRVLLRFNGLDWPHVSCATLQKVTP